MRRKSIEAQALNQLREKRAELYKECDAINARIGGINQAIETLEDLVQHRAQRRKLLKANK